MSEFLTQNTSIIFNWILPLIVGAWLVYEKFKNGSYNLRKEIVEDYKERNRQLEEQITDLKNQIHTISLQVAEFKGLLTGKEKQIESLTAILQGRNPEITQLLIEIRGLNKQLIEFLTTSNKKTSDVLDYQTEMLERGQNRDDSIDKSSKEHTGDPVRVGSK